MSLKLLLWFCLMTTPAVVVAQGPLRASKAAATLTGKVTDSVSDSPLIGAGVTVRGGDLNIIKSALTEPPSGTYEIGGLTAGQKYWVMFCHENFDPVLVLIIAPSKADRQLTRHKADPAYWNAKAGMVYADLNTGPTDRKHFEKTWQEFQESTASAEGKAYVARDLKNRLQAKPDLWEHDSLFRAYADADPKKLDEAERSIWSTTNEPVVSGLDRKLVEDIWASKAKVQPLLGDNRHPSSDPCLNPYH
jgi:hypothetical protein